MKPSNIIDKPGGYSFSFPYEGQTEDEFKKSTLSWQEYILCLKK